MGKTQFNGKWLLLVLLVPILYVAVQLYAIVSDSYTTEPAMLYTMSDTLECKGILGTQETLVSYDNNGVLTYRVENGARVTDGTVLADVFHTMEDAQNDAYAAQLAQELEVLDKMYVSAGGTDVEQLQTQSYKDLTALLQVLDTDVYTTLTDTKQSLQLTLGKRQLATGRATDFSTRINELTALREAVQVQSLAGQIMSGISGYFVAGADSRQKLYSTEQLTAMTPQELQQAAAQETPQTSASVAGKIIHDYKWSFFTTITLQEAQKFNGLTRVYLSLGNDTTQEFPATVVSIEEDTENNLAKVHLQCTYLNESVVTKEHTSAVIRFTDYQGLRIDKRALRIVDGQNGVYVKLGNIAYFRKINILFEDANYYLVPAVASEGTNEVRLYDAVILGGKNLSHGKML